MGANASGLSTKYLTLTKSLILKEIMSNTLRICGNGSVFASEV